MVKIQQIIGWVNDWIAEDPEDIKERRKRLTFVCCDGKKLGDTHYSVELATFIALKSADAEHKKIYAGKYFIDTLKSSRDKIRKEARNKMAKEIFYEIRKWSMPTKDNFLLQIQMQRWEKLKTKYGVR